MQFIKTVFVEKKYFLYLLILTFCISFYAGFLGGSFSPSHNLHIAIIDGDRLKKESIPFSTVAKLMENEVEKIRQEFMPHQLELESAFNAIKKEKNTQKAQKKKEEFDKKRATIEKIFTKKQEYLHQVQEHLSKILNETVLKTIQDIAKKKNIHVVYNRFVEDKLLIFYNDPVLDLTDQVIQKINKELAHIDIPSHIQ